MTPIYPFGTKISDTELGLSLDVPGFTGNPIKYLPKLSPKRNEHVLSPNGPFELCGYPAEREYREKGHPPMGMEWKEYRSKNGRFTVYHSEYP